MEILLNPVVASVIVLTTLCLLKFNIVIAMILSAIMAGLMADMSMSAIMDAFIRGVARAPHPVTGNVVFDGGMNSKTLVVLSYLLLGTLAYGISGTGLAAKFASALERLVGTNGKRFTLVLAGVACLSQNVIPIHIAFIPILIPPLLSLMNKLKIDRRATACALVFGLKAPYMLIPAGFGLIFHNIVRTNMAGSGMDVEALSMWKPALLPTIGMVIGLLIAVLWTYDKDRHYDDKPLIGMPEVDASAKEGFTIRHWGALIGAL
ncbi:MAG: sodium:proton antiporter, partial [Oscillospiraceae bacterium]|nr:sodium:proton antiporter [Oscillospiraceae bacterium]